jgi:hypothetical protein
VTNWIITAAYAAAQQGRQPCGVEVETDLTGVKATAKRYK